MRIIGVRKWAIVVGVGIIVAVFLGTIIGVTAYRTPKVITKTVTIEHCSKPIPCKDYFFETIEYGKFQCDDFRQKLTIEDKRTNGGQDYVRMFCECKE